MNISRFPSFIALVAASLSSHGRSPAEMDAGYRRSGLQEHQIQIIDKVVAPVGRELHESARFESNLGFKSLKIGSTFAVKSAQSHTGYSVRKWSFSELPSYDPEITASSEDLFECWSQTAEIFVTCMLVQGDKLAAAFGQRLRTTSVFLTRPEAGPEAGSDPAFDPPHMGTQPVVAGIILIGQGEEFAKAALTHFAELYGRKPLIRMDENQVNIGAGGEECKRVNGKKIADLTTQDLHIRKACAAPINDLLALASSKETTYVFSSPMGSADISIEKTGFGGVHVSIKMLHPKFLEHVRRSALAAKTAMGDYNQRQKAQKLKDF